MFGEPEAHELLNAGHPWPRRRLLVPLALGLGTALAIVLLVTAPGQALLGIQQECETRAILEVTGTRPAGRGTDEERELPRPAPGHKGPSPAASELPTLRARMLSADIIRGLVLGERVDSGRDANPGDPESLERLREWISANGCV